MGGFFAASSNVACLIQRCHAAYSTRCRSAAVTHLIRRNIHHNPSSRRNAVWRSLLPLTNMRHEAAADVVQRPMRHGLRAAGLLARFGDALIELRLGLAPALEAAQCAGTEDVLAVLPARRRREHGRSLTRDWYKMG